MDDPQTTAVLVQMLSEVVIKCFGMGCVAAIIWRIRI